MDDIRYLIKRQRLANTRTDLLKALNEALPITLLRLHVTRHQAYLALMKTTLLAKCHSNAELDKLEEDLDCAERTFKQDGLELAKAVQSDDDYRAFWSHERMSVKNDEGELKRIGEEQRRMLTGEKPYLV